MTIAQDMINWARGRLGKQVGAGQCWDLVNSAAIAAGAHGSEHFGTIGPEIDYIWGDEVDLSSVQIGDLIQTRDHKTTWTYDITITYADKTTGGDIDHAYLPRPHHSAIVTSLFDRDGALATLEQNIDPKGEVVQVQKLYTRDVPAAIATKIAMVPDPKDAKNKVKATVMTETTITVEGTIKVFRPVKR
jgi:hypothetical protein